jgi:deoxyribonuclease-1
MSKIILAIILLFVSNLFATTEIDKSQLFNKKIDSFIKKVIVENQIFYIEQNGDLLDEDIAIITSNPYYAKNFSYSFQRSKNILAKTVYDSHKKLFYSGCKYVIKKNRLIPIHKSCGFKYRKNKRRAKRVEWEHIVPAWHLGHKLKCWKRGGRLECRLKNKKFRQMEADMHNLVPVIGEINGDRSNYPYSLIKGEKRIYGKPDVEVSFKLNIFEPPKNRYGDVARTYLYMRDKYGIKLSYKQEQQFIKWNNQDPVDNWERVRNRSIAKVQGDQNPYISNSKKLKPKENPTLKEEFEEIKADLQYRYGEFLEKLFPKYALLIITVMAFLLLIFRKWMKR